VSLAESNQRHKAQAHTRRGRNGESHNIACAALVLGQREIAEQSRDDERETALQIR
jgi:hypothetical protein